MTGLALLLYEMKMALFGHEDVAGCMLNMLLQPVLPVPLMCEGQNNTCSCYFSYVSMVVCSGSISLLRAEVSGRLAFEPSEGKVSLKGGSWLQGPASCVQGRVWVMGLSGAEWWEAGMRLVHLMQTS